MMNRIIFIMAAVFVGAQAAAAMAPADIEASLRLKVPGNDAVEHALAVGSGTMTPAEDIPVKIAWRHDGGRLSVTVTALEEIYFNLGLKYGTGFDGTDCQYYMPGFWYRRNLRSPAGAPSFHTSDSWTVREDRLSTPLTGVYDAATGRYATVMRLDPITEDGLTTHKEGEVIVSGDTSIGFTGFDNGNAATALHFGYPYMETPQSYIRKLTLAPPITAFQYLTKGGSMELNWEITSGEAADYPSFVEEVWVRSFDRMAPASVESTLSDEEVKEVLTSYFTEAYVGGYPLKYTSGVHLRIADCEPGGLAEIGFLGRVLLNGFNALEYGEANGRPDLVEQGRAIFDSWEELGFTPKGFFREEIDQRAGKEASVYSIRRQSEGVYAALHFLKYEKQHGRKHPEWEKRMKSLLDNFLALQNADGSFPRKFREDGATVDASGGSTPSATLPLVMGYKYFGDKRFLQSAVRTGEYLEREIIAKADYFSSTLDANCEDKEASLYAATATHYLALVHKGKERAHYTDLCRRASYFAASWYYLWDVPFARGQMLGDIGLKTRGWGNVSVENNHIDVFIFEFADVLDWLSAQGVEPRFGQLSDVIRSSMTQLLPYEGHLCGIAKRGYNPEVVQHTAWDYGKNGKGFYNDIFAPGWVVASLWELLTPGRAEHFLNVK